MPRWTSEDYANMTCNHDPITCLSYGEVFLERLIYDVELDLANYKGIGNNM